MESRGLQKAANAIIASQLKTMNDGLERPDQFFDLLRIYINDGSEMALLSVKMMIGLPKIQQIVRFEDFLGFVLYFPEYAKKCMDIAPAFFKGLIKTKEDFQKIYAINWNMGLLFLEDDRISRIVGMTKGQAVLEHLAGKNTILPGKLEKLNRAALDLEMKYALQQQKRAADKQSLDKKDVKQMLPAKHTETKEIRSALSPKDKKDILARYTLEPIDRDAVTKALNSHFPTSKDFFYQMMFGVSGFYSTGKVDFSQHFQTFATSEEALGFAAACAYQLYSTWKHLTTNVKLKFTDPFNIVECGAGDGSLCYNILQIITKMAKVNREWESFRKIIHYNIMEISPSLVERQRNRLAEFKASVSVVEGDARDKNAWEKLGKKIAVVFSNELIDMLPPHQILFTSKDNTLRISHNLFVLTIKNYEKFFSKRVKKNDPDLSFIALKKKSKLLENVLELAIPSVGQAWLKYANGNEGLFLATKDFLKLQRKLAAGMKSDEIFSTKEVFIVEAEKIPEVAAFLKRNSFIVSSMVPNESRMVDVGIHPFFKNIDSMLISGGEVLTIDYGKIEDQQLEFQKGAGEGLRRGKNFLAGHNDLTFEPNFTVLAEEGCKLNWQLVFSGHQSQLPVNAFPEDILSSEDKKLFTNRSRTSRFRFLLHRKCSAAEVKDTKLPADAKRFSGESSSVRFAALFFNWKGRFSTAPAEVKFNDGRLLSFLSPHDELLHSAEELCKKDKRYESYLTAIKERKYGQALRKVCAVGLLPHVNLLLKHKDVLKINLQETSSDGRTAYDLIECAKVSAAIKEEIKKLLAKNGFIVKAPPAAAATAIAAKR